jgi:hypothetical protein
MTGSLNPKLFPTKQDGVWQATDARRCVTLEGLDPTASGVVGSADRLRPTARTRAPTSVLGRSVGKRARDARQDAASPWPWGWGSGKDLKSEGWLAHTEFWACLRGEAGQGSAEIRLSPKKSHASRLAELILLTPFHPGVEPCSPPRRHCALKVVNGAIVAPPGRASPPLCSRKPMDDPPTARNPGPRARRTPRRGVAVP